MHLLDNRRMQPDRQAAIEDYAQLAGDYDRSCRWLDEMRKDILAALALRPDDTVIDVACGTGAMLPALSRAVGAGGRVVGIEQSPDMAAIAREKMEQAALSNVELLVATVETADIDVTADAILFCYTHDVLQSEAALERVFRSARPGTRVVAAGARILGWWAAPVNLWKLWRSRHYLTTYSGLRDPAAGLARRCADWRVIATHVLGTSYLGCGTYSNR